MTFFSSPVMSACGEVGWFAPTMQSSKLSVEPSTRLVPPPSEGVGGSTSGAGSLCAHRGSEGGSSIGGYSSYSYVSTPKGRPISGPSFVSPVGQALKGLSSGEVSPAYKQPHARQRMAGSLGHTPSREDTHAPRMVSSTDVTPAVARSSAMSSGFLSSPWQQSRSVGNVTGDQVHSVARNLSFGSTHANSLSSSAELSPLGSNTHILPNRSALHDLPNLPAELEESPPASLATGPPAEPHPATSDHQITQVLVPPPRPPSSPPAVGGSMLKASRVSAEPSIGKQYSTNISATAAAALPFEQAPATGADVPPPDRVAVARKEAKDGEASARQEMLSALIEAEGEAARTAAAAGSSPIPQPLHTGMEREKGLPLRKSSENPAPAEASQSKQEDIIFRGLEGYGD